MSRQVRAMLGISIVGMLIALDQTVVGTALPRMVADLQGFALYPWVAAAYLLANVVLIPITGRLGDLYGRKPFLILSIVVFITASALCGLAGSMVELVLARALQGIGGGMLLGTTFAAVGDLFPDTLERVRWHAMQSVAFGAAFGMGPVLGGWMTDAFGWRSVFFINLPIGIVALLIVWLNLPRMAPLARHAGRGIDWGGALLLTLALSFVLLTLQLAEQQRPASWPFLASSTLGALTILGFVMHQRRSAAPIVPPTLFAWPSVRRLSGLALLTGFCMFVLVFYSPLLLQGGFSLSPASAGLLVTPVMVCMTLGSIVNGRLISRVAHPEQLFALGACLLMLGVGLLCRVSQETPNWAWLAIFSTCGFAFGLQLPNLTIQTQATVDREHLGIASALIQTMRTLGAMLGASVAGLLVSRGFVHWAQLALAREGIDQPAVLALFASPQLLVRAGEQAALQQISQQLGLHSERLLDLARLALIDAIRGALLLVLILAAVGYLIGRQLPAYLRVGEASPH